MTLAECPEGTSSHAVVLIGYTADTWIIQNDWSDIWGENGFIRLERGEGKNTCGMFNQ